MTMQPHHWMMLALHVAFEIFVGINFIIAPEELLDGHKPDSAFETHAWECFGPACIFWAVVLVVKANDRAILALNVIWNLLWAGLLYSMMNTPWRPESRIDSAKEWAVIPATAHAVFAVASLVAALGANTNAVGGQAHQKSA